MKRRALAVAASWGCSTIWALHHPHAAIIAVNRALGFDKDQTRA